VNRRRRIAAIAVTACAVGVLSACSSTAHPGAAAVVGDQRISAATLQAHVTAYRTAFQAVGGAQAVGAAEPAGQNQSILALLVNSAVVDHMLADQGLSVTASEVQAQEAGILQQEGSVQQLTADVVGKARLAPSDLALYVRYSLGEQKLLQQAGVQDPSTPQASARFTQMLTKAGKALGVSVNPRYGSWAPGADLLAAPKQPWLKLAPTTPQA
jgi:hypothetical protein